MLHTQSHCPNPNLKTPNRPWAMLYTQSQCQNPNLETPNRPWAMLYTQSHCPNPNLETPHHRLEQCSTHNRTAKTWTLKPPTTDLSSALHTITLPKPNLGNPQPQPWAMLYTQSHCQNPPWKPPTTALSNALHTITLPKPNLGNPQPQPQTMLYTQSSAHNCLHTIVLPKPNLGNPQPQPSACSTHNHLHTIIPALGLKDTMASWDWGARRECRRWQPLGSCQPQKRSCNQCTCVYAKEKQNVVQWLPHNPGCGFKSRFVQPFLGGLCVQSSGCTALCKQGCVCYKPWKCK